MTRSSGTATTTAVTSATATPDEREIDDPGADALRRRFIRELPAKVSPYSMPSNTLRITVEPTAEFVEAALEDREGRTDKDVRSLPDEAVLEQVLRAKNLELVRTLATEEPESIRHLARLVDRDSKNVSTALNSLEEIGLVDLEDDGHAKRPTVWDDHVEIDIQVTSRGSDESDGAPA